MSGSAAPRGFRNSTMREAGARNVTYTVFDGANHNVFAANSRMTRAAMRAFFDGILRPEAGGK
jgi:alpha-beta hydrolase superfamily lysophospholipase